MNKKGIGQPKEKSYDRTQHCNSNSHQQQYKQSSQQHMENKLKQLKNSIQHYKPNTLQNCSVSNQKGKKYKSLNQNNTLEYIMYNKSNSNNPNNLLLQCTQYNQNPINNSQIRKKCKWQLKYCMKHKEKCIKYKLSQITNNLSHTKHRQYQKNMSYIHQNTLHKQYYRYYLYDNTQPSTKYKQYQKYIFHKQASHYYIHCRLQNFIDIQSNHKHSRFHLHTDYILQTDPHKPNMYQKQ